MPTLKFNATVRQCVIGITILMFVRWYKPPWEPAHGFYRGEKLLKASGSLWRHPTEQTIHIMKAILAGCLATISRKSCRPSQVPLHRYEFSLRQRVKTKALLSKETFVSCYPANSHMLLSTCAENGRALAFQAAFLEG
jgi:hypothetical protein